MYTLLWLLLPVAAVSGWLAAKRSAAKATDLRTSGSLRKDYFQGLNFLVNEQPDKAIETLTRMLDTDSDTVATQVALGNLFRRRGEVDRAIRLHEAVVNKPGISGDVRKEARLELGHDYLRAGLLDRAETLLTELVNDPKCAEAALRHLMAVYQAVRDWEKSIETAQRLQARTGEDLRPILAQYHCELAEAALARREATNVSNLHIAQALAVDANCARASLLASRMAKDAGDYEAAIAALRRVAEQDIALIGEALPDLIDLSYRANRVAELTSFVNDLVRQHPTLVAALAASDLVESQHGARDASIFIANYLNNTPSLHALRRLVALTLNDASGELKDTLRVILTTLDRLLEKVLLYRCENCGFRGRSLHWLCPGCKAWNVVKPFYGNCPEATL